MGFIDSLVVALGSWIGLSGWSSVFDRSGGMLMDRVGAWAMNAISLVGSIASIIALMVYTADRYTGLSDIPRLTRFSVLLQLGVLTALSHGALWAITERIFAWKFGAGGSGPLPHGWSAVALSLTITIPLIVIPPAYQAVARQNVVLPNHWIAALWVLPLGALAGLVIYGFASTKFVGLSQMITPPAGPTTLGAGLARELAFSYTYFALIVFPYRLIVRPASSSVILDDLLGRTTLPALVYVFGMSVFILLKYPESLNEGTWVQVRGVLSGLILLFCFCIGMFV
jgi:hypothetical protein